MTVINALLGTFKEEHNEVEKARGAIRTYYQYLKDVEGFNQFIEGRTKEEVVINFIQHVYHVKVDATRCLNRALNLRPNSDDLFDFEQMNQAITATGKTPYWVRNDGSNILKITLPLEKEVASGSINVALCASGSPTNSVVA